VILPAFASLALTLVNRVNRAPAPVTRSGLAMLLALVGGAVLSVALIQFYRPRECAPRPSRRFLLYFAAVTLGILGMLLLLTAIAPVLGVIPGLAGIALLWIADRRLPPALLLMPREPDAAPAPVARAAASRAGLPVWLATARTLYAFEGSVGWAFLMLPMLVIYGAMMGLDRGAFAAVQVAWVWALAAMAAILPLVRLHRLDPLPISRGRLLPWIVLPIVILPILGFAGARIFAPTAGEPLVAGRWIEAEGRPGRCGMRVSAELWEVAWDGAPPPAVSPTGESHPRVGVPAVRGARPVAYNPYATPEGASPEFVAWQMSRAIRAGFGVAIAPDELQARYLTRGPDGRAAWVAGEPDPARDDPRLRPPVHLGALPLVAIAVGLPILLLLAGLMRRLADARHEAVRRRVSLLVAAGPLALSIGFVAAAMRDVLDTDALGILARSGFESLVPTALRHPVAAWAAALALLALGYGVALRAFRRLEAPGPGPGRQARRGPIGASPPAAGGCRIVGVAIDRSQTRRRTRCLASGRA
jgi:hypothetical protein